MKSLSLVAFQLIASFIISSLAVANNDQARVLSDGVAIVSIGEPRVVNEMAVYPPGGIANRPLLIMAHGSGGSGPGEINGWVRLSEQYNFTIVCPTFLSAVHSMYIPDDIAYFQECLTWIEAHVRYDKSNVYMSGMSGGGFAVWYLGTSRPDFIRGLFLQSSDFAGQYYGLDLSGWRDKPIRIVWGSNDLPNIPQENDQAIDALRSAGCRQYSSQVILGATHQEHPDLVVDWLERESKTPGVP